MVTLAKKKNTALILRSAASLRRVSKDGDRHGRGRDHPSKRARKRALLEDEA
jgi:hypothetical protein